MDELYKAIEKKIKDTGYTREYHITVMDEEFNLGILTIRTPEGVFETNFDE